MRIGELAQSSGTPIKTIRFYEREVLLPAAARTEGNYRIYTPQHAERLAFIRQCRSLDMTPDELRVLLMRVGRSCRASPGRQLDELSGHPRSGKPMSTCCASMTSL